MIKKQQMQRLQVFQNRAYLLYFIGRTVSWTGNSMQFIANSWLALELTGQAYSVALVLIASSLPGIVFAPVIGLFVDRIDRKWLAAIMDTFSALVLCAIVLLWYLKLLQIWHIYMLSFLLALSDAIYSPSITGLIREVVPQDELLYANTTSGVALQIGGVVGAALGGILIALTSPILVMSINAASFFFSAWCIFSMRKGYFSPSATTAQIQGFKRYITDIGDGLFFIKEHRDIIVKYLMMFSISTTLYTLNVLIAPFTKNVLHVGVSGFGYMEGAFAIGAIMSNWLLPGLTQRYGNSRTMTVGMCCISISLFLLVIAQNLPTALVSYFLLGATFQVGVLLGTRVQEAVPSSYQGRVFSTFSLFSSLSSLIVFFCMGFLAGIFSVRFLYGFQCILLVIAGVLAYRYIYLADKKNTAAAPQVVE